MSKQIKPTRTQITIEGYHKLIDGWQFELEGINYFIPTWTGGHVEGIIQSIYWDKQKGYCVNRQQDFGGCEKDALKTETGVPLSIWITEIEPYVFRNEEWEPFYDKCF